MASPEYTLRLVLQIARILQIAAPQGKGHVAFGVTVAGIPRFAKLNEIILADFHDEGISATATVSACANPAHSAARNRRVLKMEAGKTIHAETSRHPILGGAWVSGKNHGGNRLGRRQIRLRDRSRGAGVGQEQSFTVAFSDVR